MNQTVVRMYVLVAALVLAVVLSAWPKLADHRPRVLGWVRFGGVFGLGLGFALFAFETAGRVDEVRVGTERAFVLERFPGRLWGDSVWTGVHLSDGAVKGSPPSPGASAESRLSSAPGSLSLPRSLRASLRRPLEGDSGGFRPVGPTMEQPVLAEASAGHAVVSAYDTVYEPDTLYVARYDAQGQLQWRREGRDIGVQNGRLRRSVSLPGGDLLLVFTGTRAQPNLLERLTHSSHIIVLRLESATGRVRWTSHF